MTDILVSAGIIVLLILFGGAVRRRARSRWSRCARARSRRWPASAASGSPTWRSRPTASSRPCSSVVTAAGLPVRRLRRGAAVEPPRSRCSRTPACPSGLSDVVSLIAITLIISYFAIVAGELVPKRLALQRAERTALLLAPLVDRAARISRPGDLAAVAQHRRARAHARRRPRRASARPSPRRSCAVSSRRTSR